MSSDDRESRRRFLQITGGLATGFAVAGCSGGGGDGGDGGNQSGGDGGDGGNQSGGDGGNQSGGDGGTTAMGSPTETQMATETETSMATETQGPTTTAGPGNTSTPMESGEYATWLFAPGTVSKGRKHYEFSLLDLAIMRQNGQRLGRTYQMLKGILSKSLGKVGIKWGEAGGLLTVAQGSQSGSGGTGAPSANILLGSFGAQSVTGGLTEQKFNKATTYGGFELYEQAEDAGGGGGSFQVASGVVAVKEGVLVTSADRSAVEAAIDARNGDVQRYGEANDDFATLNNTLETGLTVRGGTNEKYSETKPSAPQPQFAGQVASGQYINIEGKTTSVNLSVVFDAASSVDTEAVNSWIEKQQGSGQLSKAKNLQVSADGRVVTASGEVPTEDLFSSGRLTAPELRQFRTP